MVSLQLIWVAAGFLAPAGRQPLLQRRVLLLAAKKGKEAFVPYEISGDSVPMFPLPERRDAVQARSGRAALPPTRLPCAWRPSLRPWLPPPPPLALCRSPVLLLASHYSPLAIHLSLPTSRCCSLLACSRLHAPQSSLRAVSCPDAASASASASPSAAAGAQEVRRQGRIALQARPGRA